MLPPTIIVVFWLGWQTNLRVSPFTPTQHRCFEFGWGGRRTCELVHTLIPNTAVLYLAGVAGFEPTNAGIKIPCLTAWRHPNDKVCGAGDKFRTCYLQSHNLALYRLSYARHISCAPKELLYRRYAQPACTGWAKRSFLSPHFLVRPERLEPPTHGLEGRCSILLSYGRIKHKVEAPKPLFFGAGDGNRTHATSLEG